MFDDDQLPAALEETVQRLACAGQVCDGAEDADAEDCVEDALVVVGGGGVTVFALVACVLATGIRIEKAGFRQSGD